MMACPTCRRPVPPDSPSRPFCEPRCRLLDLGNWLDGRYLVPAAEEEDADGVNRPAEEEDADGVNRPAEEEGAGGAAPAGGAPDPESRQGG